LSYRAKKVNLFLHAADIISIRIIFDSAEISASISEPLYAYDKRFVYSTYCAKGISQKIGKFQDWAHLKIKQGFSKLSQFTAKWNVQSESNKTLL